MQARPDPLTLPGALAAVILTLAALKLLILLAEYYK